jgi:hypothetical protein
MYPHTSKSSACLLSPFNLYSVCVCLVRATCPYLLDLSSLIIFDEGFELRWFLKYLCHFLLQRKYHAHIYCQKYHLTEKVGNQHVQINGNGKIRPDSRTNGGERVIMRLHVVLKSCISLE